MRSTLVSIAALCLGCTLTPGSGMGGAFATSGASESGDEPDAEESESSAAPDPGEGSEGESSSGWATFGSTGEGVGSEEGSTSAGSSSSTGAPVDSGPAEPGGAYAACDTSEDCGMEPPGLACLHADENGAGGFCSPPCGTYGATPPDASLCPDSPAGATVVCLEGLVRNCALACQDDGDCPENTACLTANGGAGPYCFGA